MTTGCVTVKGTHFQKWIDSDFRAVSKHVPPTVDETGKEVEEEDDEIIPSGKKMNPENAENEETNDIAEQLWEENKKLRNAISNLEEALKTKTCNCSLDEERIKKIFDEKAILLEKKYDEIVTTFTKTIEREFRKDIKEAKKVMGNKIDETRDDFIKLKVNYEDENNGLYYKINALEKNIKELENKIEKNNTPPKLNSLEKTVKDLENRIETTNKAPDPTSGRSVSQTQPNRPSYDRENQGEVDLIMFFDSNGKYIDRKKLWKQNNSLYVRCGQLEGISNYIDSARIVKVNHILINVGCNDLDRKNCRQVFNDLQELVSKIKNKWENIKFIISEITPRRDHRDNDVIEFNDLLFTYAKNRDDTTIAFHHNLRDSNWSMFHDAKHIRQEKIPIFAANIIRALKKSYNIREKSELFTNTQPSTPTPLMSKFIPLPAALRNGNSYHHHHQPSRNVTFNIPPSPSRAPPREPLYKMPERSTVQPNPGGNSHHWSTLV